MRRLLPLLLVATSAFAQVRESITVEVIEVPVYVSAPDGTPLRGLKKDAFQLFANGKPQAIDYFDAIDYGARNGTSAQRAPAPRDTRERRLYLLLFDLGYTRPGFIERAQKGADAAVLRSNPATDYFAVATFTHAKGVQFVIPFMNDYVVVRRAIATLKPNDVHDPLGVGISSARRRMWAEIEAKTQGEPLAFAIGTEKMPADDNTIDTIRGGDVNQEISRQPIKEDVQQQFAGFGEAAARLAALEGQKHVVLFSVGFNPLLFVDIGRGFGEDPRLHRYMNDMFKAFGAAGAFLDSIDLVGNRSADSSEALRRMAEGTGGQIVRNTNDVAEAFQRLTTDQQVVYLLGFKRGEKTEGDIDVKVSGVPRGTQVSFRRGYGKPQARGDLDPLQLADIVVNDIAQNGLSLKLEATPKEIAILFRPSEIVAQLLPEKPYVEAMLYVFDEHGATALFRSKRLPFDAKKAPIAGVAGVREATTLPPGRYVVKALLHVAGTPAVGFARSELVVP